MSWTTEIRGELNKGNVHQKLLAELTKNKITPIAFQPVKRGHAPGEWELHTTGDTRYTITDDEDKLNVLRPDKTFFVFAMLVLVLDQMMENPFWRHRVVREIARTAVWRVAPRTPPPPKLT